MHKRHDKTYKLLYNFPYVVEAFLREFGPYLRIPDYILDVLNYATLRREPSDFLTNALRERFCDRLWRLDPSAMGAGCNVSVAGRSVAKRRDGRRVQGCGGSVQPRYAGMVRTGGFLLFDTQAYQLDNDANLGIMSN